MEINFVRAIANLGGTQGILRLVNASRPASDYLLATFLPQRLRAGYVAKDGVLVVRSTMAGLVGMDSKLPEGGAIDVNTFAEQIAKLGIQHNLDEKTRREIRENARTIFDAPAAQGGGQAGVDQYVERVVLNFVNKLLIQPLDDREEWLRGQVLGTGAIAWTFNGIPLTLDYQVPAGNKFPTRTGTAAYGGSASVFWDDVKLARRTLKGQVGAVIGHSSVIDAIIYNSANSINILGDGQRVQIQRYRGSLERASTDARETLTLIRYDKEGEVLDPDGSGNTKKLPFFPVGALTFVASTQDSTEIDIGAGSTDNPDNQLELGWTQLGPTEEADGQLGRWSRVYTPEAMPMQLRGQAAENALPVLRGRGRLVIASTVVP